MVLRQHKGVQAVGDDAEQPQDDAVSSFESAIVIQAVGNAGIGPVTVIAATFPNRADVSDRAGVRRGSDPGAWPTTRLKARAKANSESHPTSRAMRRSGAGPGGDRHPRRGDVGHRRLAGQLCDPADESGLRGTDGLREGLDGPVPAGFTVDEGADPGVVRSGVDRRRARSHRALRCG